MNNKTKPFHGSNTFVFIMLWPWVSGVGMMILHEIGVIDVLNFGSEIQLGIIITPVIIAAIWFIVARKINT